MRMLVKEMRAGRTQRCGEAWHCVVGGSRATHDAVYGIVWARRMMDIKLSEGEAQGLPSPMLRPTPRGIRARYDGYDSEHRRGWHAQQTAHASNQQAKAEEKGQASGFGCNGRPLVFRVVFCMASFMSQRDLNA